MHKLERDFRVHSYTQLTMSFFSQLGKNKISCSRWNTWNEYGKWDSVFSWSVALNISVPAVIHCVTDRQFQNAMIINTVHQVYKNLIDVCITGKACVDNTEWVSSTCHSNLSDEKLPVYLRANKMNFPVKPECLNFTPLEERLKSLCIPFMQIISF